MWCGCRLLIDTTSTAIRRQTSSLTRRRLTIAPLATAWYYNVSSIRRHQPLGVTKLFPGKVASSSSFNNERIPKSRGFAATTSLPFAKKTIKILYASQGGTAQLFAMQLASRLEEVDMQVDGVTALSDVDPETLHQNADGTLHVFIVSTAGVGEPPDNGRTFYQKLLDKDSLAIDYVLFGLGNSQAHASNYCQFAKDLENALQERGATSAQPLTLGDDGGISIEDDFDQFQEDLVEKLLNKQEAEAIEPVAAETTTSVASSFSREKTAYADLHLQFPQEIASSCMPKPHDHLMNICRDYYAENAALYPVLRNSVIRLDSTGSGTTNLSALREMQFQTNGEPYETGDHVIVYPQNNDTLVESYLNVIEDCPEPNAILNANSKNYPHPTGLSVFDTLRHCVDLQAVPTPSFARFLTGNHHLNYKEDVVIPRRTVLELLLESPSPRILLKELLYQLPKLSPRYYSIASSNSSHPSTIYLTYRPVNYVTTRGIFRNGVCTSYMSHLSPGQTILAAIRSNPLFRLPSSSEPLIMIAGGCGVAPIRAFLEELVHNARCGSPKSYGKVILFLGFRNPDDDVYQELVTEAESLEIIEEKFITYSTGCLVCSLVSDAVQQNGANLYRLMVEEKANVYVCGGARTFGVAIQNAMLDILQKEGKMTSQQAKSCMQNFIQENRYHEDLSD